MLNVIESGLLLLAGLYGIPVSFRWMDKRVAVRAARRAELEQLRFERSRALAARKVVES